RENRMSGVGEEAPSVSTAAFFVDSLTARRSMNSCCTDRRALELLGAALVLLVLAAPARGAVNRWSSDGPEPGRVDLITVDGRYPVTILGNTNSGGLYKSSAGLSAWTAIDEILGIGASYVTDLAIAPDSSSKVYTSVYGAGVYKSKDGGRTWRPVNTG